MVLTCPTVTGNDQGGTMEELLDPMGQGIAAGGCYPAEEGHEYEPDLADVDPYDLPDVDELIEDHLDGYDLPHPAPAPEPIEDWCGTGDGMELFEL
jgi:hypothetical protein